MVLPFMGKKSPDEKPINRRPLSPVAKRTQSATRGALGRASQHRSHRPHLSSQRCPEIPGVAVFDGIFATLNGKIMGKQWGI